MDSNLTLIINGGKGSKEEGTADIEKIMDYSQVFFYSVVFVLGVLGNGLVIWITGFKMQKTVNSIWFLNLALADFLFSLTRCIPLIKNGFFSYWPFGDFLCKTNSFLKYLNMFGSVFLLAFISLDRCTSVVLPVWSKNHRKPRLAWMISAFSWLLAVVASFPFCIFRSVILDSKNKTKCSLTLSIELSKNKEFNKQVLFFHRFISGFLIPFLIILSCYIIIAIKLKQKNIVKSKKPFKVILAIILTFFLCWTPYHIFLLLKLMNVKGLVMTIGSPLSSSLAYLNSCINPFLYFFMGLDFQKKVKQSIFSVFVRSLLDETVFSEQTKQRMRDTSIDRLAEMTITAS
ncbi:chemokine-like receptor 1 [Microcaecilia unicolor]|uniref:Chemokine-like receptor 1 n=1 Tax=Microcaecilia unicolor TaxID=1415580 RepID=A0A6P7YWI5_9AMPH|nr:chemokine-like receptor 1 [Microcaecilia unicolor]